MNGWSRQYVYGFTGTAYITCRDLVVDVEAGNRPTQQIRKEAAAQQEVAIWASQLQWEDGHCQFSAVPSITARVATATPLSQPERSIVSFCASTLVAAATPLV